MNASIRQGKRTGVRLGFTLIELLVVVAIIGILSSLVLAGVSHSKSLGKRISCLSNLRQLTQASLVYADDDRHGSYSGRTDRSDQDLNWLLPYVGDRQMFSCASTKNTIRELEGYSPWTGHRGLVDLIDLAGGRNEKSGSSYIGYGFFSERTPRSMFIRVNGNRIEIPVLRRSINNVSSYEHFNDAFGLSGQIIGASQQWIILDGNGADNAHYPDGDDNHGSSGANVGFCDGHVEWVKQSKYIYRYEVSQDANRTSI